MRRKRRKTLAVEMKVAGVSCEAAASGEWVVEADVRHAVLGQGPSASLSSPPPR